MRSAMGLGMMLDAALVAVAALRRHRCLADRLDAFDLRRDIGHDLRCDLRQRGGDGEILLAMLGECRRRLDASLLMAVAATAATAAATTALAPIGTAAPR